MKPLHYLAACLLAAPLLVALVPRGDSLSFHPSNGTTVSKEAELHLTVDLGDITAEADGQDISQQIPSEASAVIDVAMAWTDKYVEVEKDKNRPKELIRKYETLSGKYDASAAGDSKSGDIENFDALANHSVKFQWNAEKDAYDISFHECTGDEKLLKSQTDDLDLRAILPDKEVSAGDTWEVEGSKLGHMLFGASKFDEADIPADNPMADVLKNEILPQIQKLGKSFKVTCEYKGQREVDGDALGVIAIESGGDGTIDLSAAIQAAIEGQMPEGMDMDLSIKTAALNTHLSGKGEALWDLKAGHVHSGETELEFTASLNVDMTMNVQGQSHSLKAEVEVPGKIHWKMTTK